ncbi:MAG: hypothetical protein M3Y82_05075 [Verrucomicrobiota bacterium]|nr:hypothetical protein [Verrucomicrobiota bacterium]
MEDCVGMFFPIKFVGWKIIKLQRVAKKNGVKRRMKKECALRKFEANPKRSFGLRLELFYFPQPIEGDHRLKLSCTKGFII